MVLKYTELKVYHCRVRNYDPLIINFTEEYMSCFSCETHLIIINEQVSCTQVYNIHSRFACKQVNIVLSSVFKNKYLIITLYSK